MDQTTRRILRQALAAIEATNLPAELERRLLLELRARFGELPEAQA